MAETANGFEVHGTSPGKGNQPAKEGRVEAEAAQTWSEGLEAVIRELLLWAQMAKSSNGDHDAGKTLFHKETDCMVGHL